MSIQSEISRIKTNIANALNAVAAKGVTIPTGANSDNLAELISQISPTVEPPYINLLPTSIDTDGSIYNGKGFSTGYLSSGVVTANSSRSVSGFMPIGYGSANSARGEQIIYFENINIPVGDNYVRIAYYTGKIVDGIQVPDQYIIQQSAVINDNNKSFLDVDNGEAISLYTHSDGMIKTVDVTGYTAYLKKTLNKEVAFFRVSVPGATGITADSIITVNQEIVDNTGG